MKTIGCNWTLMTSSMTDVEHGLLHGAARLCYSASWQSRSGTAVLWQENLYHLVIKMSNTFFELYGNLPPNAVISHVRLAHPCAETDPTLWYSLECFPINILCICFRHCWPNANRMYFAGHVFRLLRLQPMHQEKQKQNLKRKRKHSSMYTAQL